MLDLSIIIVSYNNLGILKDCLESIHKFTSKVNFEVIVVDNNGCFNDTSDARIEIIENIPPDVSISFIDSKAY
jgi:GT2 family glycosyltransferase